MKLTYAIAALMITTGAATANNLTSLGVDAAGNTAWRITSTHNAPQHVTLRQHGTGNSIKMIVNPGTSQIVYGTPGTYIAEFESDGRKVTKASGPQAFNPGPVNGQDGADGQNGAPGKDGRDGKDGADGRSFDQAAYDRQMRNMQGQMAADRAAGNLQTRTAGKGQWTGALGVSGNEYGADGIAGGVRYGISDRADLYAVVGMSDRGQMSWGLGATFILGGN